jgi:hypothetical protein
VTITLTDGRTVECTAVQEVRFERERDSVSESRRRLVRDSALLVTLRNGNERIVRADRVASLTP